MEISHKLKGGMQGIFLLCWVAGNAKQSFHMVEGRRHLNQTYCTLFGDGSFHAKRVVCETNYSVRLASKN